MHKQSGTPKLHYMCPNSVIKFLDLDSDTDQHQKQIIC